MFDETNNPRGALKASTTVEAFDIKGLPIRRRVPLGTAWDVSLDKAKEMAQNVRSNNVSTMDITCVYTVNL